MVKKLLLVLLSVVLLGLVFPAAVFGEEKVADFDDVPADHWAYGAVQTAVAKGYVAGYPDGTFKPNQDVTRAEFMRMLVDALNLPRSQGGSPWYQPYVAVLLELGIHREADYNENYNQPLTRLEMVKLAIRAVDATYQTEMDVEDANFMVYQATGKGILHGIGAGELSLGGTSTRAQAVAIIERILAVNEGRTLPVDKYAVASAEVLWHRTNIFTVMPHFFNDPINERYIADLGMRSWKMENLVLENEYFRGELTELIAIDLSDPQDPNRRLLPELDQLYEVTNNQPIPEDAYILVLRYQIDKNMKPKSYSGHMELSFFGYDHDHEAKVNRALPVRTDDEHYEWINTWREGTSVWVMPGSEFKLDSALEIQLNSYNFFGYEEELLHSFIVSSVVSKKVW